MTAKDMDAINRVSEEAYSINVANGWWDDRAGVENAHHAGEVNVTIACLGLIMSEAAEAIEAVRKHPRQAWAETTTKDTFARELAGIVIRTMDLAERKGVDLGEAIRAELEANKTRGRMHGGKAA